MSTRTAYQFGFNFGMAFDKSIGADSPTFSKEDLEAFHDFDHGSIGKGRQKQSKSAVKAKRSEESDAEAFYDFEHGSRDADVWGGATKSSKPVRYQSKVIGRLDTNQDGSAGFVLYEAPKELGGLPDGRRFDSEAAARTQLKAWGLAVDAKAIGRDAIPGKATKSSKPVRYQSKVIGRLDTNQDGSANFAVYADPPPGMRRLPDKQWFNSEANAIAHLEAWGLTVE